MVDVVPDDASVFYNLASHEGERAVARLRELGGRDRAPRGLAATSTSTSASIPSSRGTTPIPEYMTAPIDGAVNVMTAPWFDPEHYRSDSNQHWRHGCPHDELARGDVRVAAAADPPGDLGLRRRDDGRHDAVVPRRRPRRAARAAARGSDRPS